MGMKILISVSLPSDWEFLQEDVKAFITATCNTSVHLFLHSKFSHSIIHYFTLFYISFTLSFYHLCLQLVLSHLAIKYLHLTFFYIFNPFCSKVTCLMKGYTPNLVVLAVALNFHILHLNHIIQITVLKILGWEFCREKLHVAWNTK